MTIKEMQKVYKKVSKAINEFYVSRGCMESSDHPDILAEYAKNMVKAWKVLDKVSAAMNANNLELVNKAINEESFVRWCLLENIDYKTSENETEDVETEE